MQISGVRTRLFNFMVGFSLDTPDVMLLKLLYYITKEDECGVYVNTY